ncbi:hypothetical protein QOZ80_5BG0423530 [Eleusine coracana subsp. coracana]|nr:hypothetical protein QOZ80_5BG0423530 [Eleusine coracana subsp. coracana]
MAREDRLSSLSDDLLLRILHFTHFKEAASTGVLSRRWRHLWRSSGAVNLTVNLQTDGYQSYYKYSHDGSERAAVEAFLSRRDAFLHAAESALAAAAASRITRLTLRVDAVSDHTIRDFIRGSYDRDDVDLAAAIVSHPTARHVEELRVAPVVYGDHSSSFGDREMSWRNIGVYSLVSLPLETLRVLDLTRMMEGAPVLRLRCPAATTLVLSSCGVDVDDYKEDHGNGWEIEVDAPQLQQFTYKGVARRFSLMSPAPDMAQVDLHFLPPTEHYVEESELLSRFWQFVQCFTNANKALKIKVNYYLDNIAVVGKVSRAELLCAFPGVESLELEGAHNATTTGMAAVAIANLLRCCPAVRDLKLKLSTTPPWRSAKKEPSSDFDKSLESFRHGRLEPLIDNYGDINYEEITNNVPGLSGRSFACLQGSLRRVRIQFRLDESSFGVQLVKFFADNAMALEEIHVDTGNRRLCEHMTIDIERWITSNLSNKFRLKQKNTDESSWEFSKINMVGSIAPTTDMA